MYRKPQQICFRSKRTYSKGDEYSWKFSRKSTVIWGRSQYKQDYMNNFHRGDKKGNLRAKLWRFDQKRRKISKFKFFDQNLYGKLTFSQFNNKYFLDFCIISETSHQLSITIFPDFCGGGGRSGLPPSRPYWLYDLFEKQEWFQICFYSCLREEQDLPIG